jgi:peptidoglycan/LPS O-acetylase OafA/YrhL
VKNTAPVQQEGFRPEEEVDRVTKVKRVIELDFLRGIAILLVLDAHLGSKWYSFFHFAPSGQMGVDLFFVLSGFLVGGLLMKEWKKSGAVDGMRFLKRRAFKIWPAYYFYILFVALLHQHPWKTFLVANFLNIQNYLGSSLTHTWSLAVEEHFYLGMTLLMIFVSRRKFSHALVLAIYSFLAICAVVSLLVSAHMEGYRSLFYTHVRVEGLIFGVILALLFNFFPVVFHQLQQRKITLWLFLFICCGVVLFRQQIRLPLMNEYLFADLGSVAVLLLAFRVETNPQRNFLYRTIAFIGVYSYGIYLWFLGVARATSAAEVRFHLPDFWALEFLPYFLAILTGIIVTKLIEFPFLKLRERLVPASRDSHLRKDPDLRELQEDALSVPVPNRP